MNPCGWLLAVVVIAWYGLSATSRAQFVSAPPSVSQPSGPWPVDRVVLRDGRELCGLIESEDPLWLHLIEIRRVPGRPMSLVLRPIDLANIARTVRLEPGARQTLQREIEQFRNRASIEAARMDAVRLTSRSEQGVRHYGYEGKWFTLDCSTDEETARRIIVRAEQVFAAYRQTLAPRTSPQRALRVSVFGSLEEYQARLHGLRLKITNRAVFLPGEHLVLAGSELGRYSAELTGIEKRHRAMLDDLRKTEQELPGRLKQIGRQLQEQGLPKAQIRDLLNREKRNADEEIHRKQAEMRRVERHNDRAFERVAGQMLARLWHEGFHAYVEDYVYPSRTHQVPHWLNEGLATMFEEGFIDVDVDVDTASGVFRLDAPHRAALAGLQADLAGSHPLALEELLAADARAFLVGSDDSPALSRRYYYYAWGLVHYLTFDRHLLAGDRLDAYVARQPAQVSAVARFERLVGMPLAEFEGKWRKHVRTLRWGNAK